MRKKENSRKESERRDAVQIEHDRAEIARLYLQGWLQKDIALELKLSPNTVSRDLRAIRNDWRASAMADTQELIDRQWAKLERIEREAWRAWEDSRKAETGERSTTQYGGEGAEVRYSQTRKASPGDTKYMDIIRWCWEQYAKLAGLYAPDKHEHTGPNGGPIAHAVASELTDAQLMDIIIKSQKKT